MKLLINSTATLALATMITYSAPSFAAIEVGSNEALNKPSGSAMALDATLARPLLLGATLVGAGLFVISLPFSIMGGNVEGTAEALVFKPAYQTFFRCLGCTPAQDRLKISQQAELAATSGGSTGNSN